MEGVIKLSDGMLIRLDGISCSKEGLSNLSRLLLNPESSVAFQAQPLAGVQPVPARIWLVDSLDIGDVKPTLSYSRVAESALLSGWCVPAKTETSAGLDDRYAEIAVIGARLSEEK